MKHGVGFDSFDDDLDTGPEARRARLAPDASEDAIRQRWAAEDEREVRTLYARAGVWSRR